MPPPAVETPDWLRNLPVAPEFRPTAAEFADPIAYILKIEAEASRYGICKIVPPLAPPPRDATVERLKASFAANATSIAAGDVAAPAPTFPTRVQQVGFSAKNRRPASRRVWESGERYTLEAFRAKARDIEIPRHAVPPKHATQLQLEALFWGACAGKPFNVEYGNDMPGSGFAAPEELNLDLEGAGGNAALAARDVGETEWNMRLAPRARGSLLQAMGRDVAGVTTPMLYVAMLYSWFAWHVEDHELHSLNYLHFGKSKTWYGVPRDAMLAFEDAVRVHGYADGLNAIMAFQILNEKTTVLSPEVLLSAGVPCCRLVQNPGEFVITFPGAYHSGFSHGFNCGEATNIATPCWLQVAKEAAIRRASTNSGPMVSHYQLLYQLALSLHLREPKNCHMPRSSRLRDKKKNEGERMIKETFVGSVIENNSFLSILLDKSSCVIIPEIEFPLPSRAPEVNDKQGLIAGPCSISQQKAKETIVYGDEIDEIKEAENLSESTTSSACSQRKFYETKFGTVNSTAFCLSTSDIKIGVIGKGRSHQGGGLLDQGLLPCVQCGILSYACVAIIQPKEAAVQYVISRECMSSSAIHREIMKSDDTSNRMAIARQQGYARETDDNTRQSVSAAQVSDRCRQLYCSSTHGCTSALGLLASAYESSDSDEEAEAPNNISNNCENNDAANGVTNIQSSGTSVQDPNTIFFEKKKDPNTNLHLYEEENDPRAIASLMQPVEDKSIAMTPGSMETNMIHLADQGESLTSHEQWHAYLDLCDDLTASGVKASPYTSLSTVKGAMETDALTLFKYSKDSCRMHVFCLEHALETWTRLEQIGGANIMLLCNPEYPRAESAAKVIAKELGMKHAWKDITFKKATHEDTRRIQLALQDEDAEPTSSDWAVKMGINIYYSAKQSKSPLYSKQVPYNSIIYNAFAQENPDSLTDEEGQRSGATKKKVAGWWCGKNWMSNQVHPLLAREQVEQNHETVYSKAIFSASSCGMMQEQSTRSTTLMNQSSSKKISRRKEGNSVEKSRGKKKRNSASASDEAALHYTVYDQPVNFDNHAKYEDGDESESGEAQNTRQHQQHASRNKKSCSKRRKDNNRSNRFYELHKDNDDIDCRFDIDSTENTSIGDWDNSPQGCDLIAVKSNAQWQGSKRFSKEKASDGLSNVNKKLLKMGKKMSTKNQKNDKTNRQFQENLKKTDIVDLLHEDDGGEATYIKWNEIPKQKTDDVRVKSRGKMRSGKKKVRKCQASDDLHNGGKEGKFSSDIEVCNRRDGTAVDNWEEIPKEKTDDVKVNPKMQSGKKKTKHQANDGLRNGDKGAKFSCDIEGCDMSFSTQHDLLLHKKDICPVKGCKKKFFCHKYLLQHRKVHLDERPLMCSFPGCKKTFKWPWARTEHMRVHTGVRPYACTEPGCTQTFRFVSDFSRHKRKTGHSCDKKKNNGT